MFCAEEQQRLFWFLRSCVSGPASNWGGVWGVRLSPGPEGSEVGLETGGAGSALPCSQPAWIRCIKNICGLSERPPSSPRLHKQRAPRDWLLPQAQALHLDKKVESFRGGTLIANPKCSFEFFFSSKFTHSWCIQMVKQSLCAALLPLKVLSLSCPNHNNCKIHHRVYVLSYTQYLKDLQKNSQSA